MVVAGSSLGFRIHRLECSRLILTVLKKDYSALYIDPYEGLLV